MPVQCMCASVCMKHMHKKANTRRERNDIRSIVCVCVGLRLCVYEWLFLHTL